MKKFIGLVIIAISLSATVLAQEVTKVQSTTVHQHRHAVKPMYTCTMHPEVRRSKPGKCPKCGMKLVKMNHKTKKAERGKMVM